MRPVLKFGTFFFSPKILSPKILKLKKFEGKKNLKLKKNRSCATRVEMFREPIFENLARGFSTSKILLEPEVRHGRSAEIVRFQYLTR